MSQSPVAYAAVLQLRNGKTYQTEWYLSRYKLIITVHNLQSRCSARVLYALRIRAKRSLPVENAGVSPSHGES